MVTRVLALTHEREVKSETAWSTFLNLKLRNWSQARGKPCSDTANNGDRFYKPTVVNTYGASGNVYTQCLLGQESILATSLYSYIYLPLTHSLIHINF